MPQNKVVKKGKKQPAQVHDKIRNTRCPAYNGTGRVRNGKSYQPCMACDGRGYV